MMYSVQRLCEERVAVVLVERRALSEPQASDLLRQLQDELSVPVMLVARNSEGWLGIRARAEFDPEPYVYALLGMRDIEWAPLRRRCETEGA
jgi:hypothetical protein